VLHSDIQSKKKTISLTLDFSLFLGIAILDSFLVTSGAILLLSTCGLGYAIYHQFVLPILARRGSNSDIPVAVGDKYDYVVDEATRNGIFTIGCKTGNISTRCHGITEDHLIFQLKKARDTEDYTVTILKNGPTLFRPPRMEIFGKMEPKETIESYEIIGHSTEFRISDRIAKDRMIHYVQVSLASSFYFNKVGKERMRFTFSVTKIQPGVIRKIKLKDDTYGFGKEEGTEEHSEEEE